MKLVKLGLLLMVMFLAACQTTRQPEILSTEFQALQPISLNPILPSRPKGEIVETVTGEQYIGFTIVGMNELNTYAKQSEANTVALKELASSHNSLIEQRNLLTQIVRQQEERGNMYSRLYTESQNELESVRRHSMIERAVLQALLIIGLGL